MKYKLQRQRGVDSLQAGHPSCDKASHLHHPLLIYQVTLWKSDITHSLCQISQAYWCQSLQQPSWTTNGQKDKNG